MTWAIVAAVYLLTVMIGFIMVLICLPPLGSNRDHLKYMMAGLFWPIYLMMWAFGFRLRKKFYLPCPALDKWKRYNNENNDPREDQH